MSSLDHLTEGLFFFCLWLYTSLMFFLSFGNRPLMCCRIHEVSRDHRSVEMTGPEILPIISQEFRAIWIPGCCSRFSAVAVSYMDEGHGTLCSLKLNLQACPAAPVRTGKGLEGVCGCGLSFASAPYSWLPLSAAFNNPALIWTLLKWCFFIQREIIDEWFSLIWNVFTPVIHIIGTQLYKRMPEHKMDWVATCFENHRLAVVLIISYLINLLQNLQMLAFLVVIT